MTTTLIRLDESYSKSIGAFTVTMLRVVMQPLISHLISACSRAYTLISQVAAALGQEDTYKHAVFKALPSLD